MEKSNRQHLKGVTFFYKVTDYAKATSLLKIAMEGPKHLGKYHRVKKWAAKYMAVVIIILSQ